MVAVVAVVVSRGGTYPAADSKPLTPLAADTSLSRKYIEMYPAASLCTVYLAAINLLSLKRRE
jgi:hypothetical protein